MASKSSAVRSIRLPNDVWAQLSTEAEKREVTVNSLVHDLVIVGLLAAGERRASPAAPPPRPKVAPKVETAPKPAFKSRLKGEWKAP